MFYIEPTDVPLVNTAYWGPPKILTTAQKALSFNMGSSTNVESINFQYNALRPVQVRGYVMDRISGIEIPINIFDQRLIRTNLLNELFKNSFK